MSLYILRNDIGFFAPEDISPEDFQWLVREAEEYARTGYYVKFDLVFGTNFDFSDWEKEKSKQQLIEFRQTEFDKFISETKTVRSRPRYVQTLDVWHQRTVCRPKMRKDYHR